MSAKQKAVLMRLLKGFIAGAFTAMGMITWATPTSWLELKTSISILALAGIAGGINGLVMAGEKWINWTE